MGITIMTKRVMALDESDKLSLKETGLIVGILTTIAILITFDLINDYNEGKSFGHLITEGLVVIIACIGTVFLLKSIFSSQKKLTWALKDQEILRQESMRWKSEAQKFIHGLGSAIDQQLIAWGLTSAEKDVTFLLLKGLGLKEIAELRKTSEKTVRAQCSSVYQKSGVAGRTELAAFFLEDLLPPSN